MFFSYFFTFWIHEAWTFRETSKKKAIFEKYVDVLCVYVIYIYIYIYIYDDECSTQLCSCSFVRIVVAKLEKITL